MINKIKLFVIAALMLLMPILSVAEEAGSLPEMTKDVWLAQVKKAVPEPICKSFIEDESIAALMTAHTISYDKCLSLIPPIAESCQKKYYLGIPKIIDRDSAEKWGQMIGECIGTVFAMEYLSKS